MNYRLVLVVAWAVATSVSVLVGFAAIASVRTAIDAPGSFRLPSTAAVSLLPPEEAELTAIISARETDIGPSSPTTSPQPATTVAARKQSSMAATPATSSPTTSLPSTTGAVNAAASTTAPSVDTSSTAASNTYEVAGGWVTIGSDDTGVYLDSASPKPGWTVKVEGQGPEEVKVVFKAKGEEIHFVARFTKGEVRISIED